MVYAMIALTPATHADQLLPFAQVVYQDST